MYPVCSACILFLDFRAVMSVMHWSSCPVFFYLMLLSTCILLCANKHGWMDFDECRENRPVTVWEMLIMNPQHFGIDPADIVIRIRINPEIWIGIPDDHFWLKLDALAEVCALWAQSIDIHDHVYHDHELNFHWVLYSELQRKTIG